MTASPAAGMPSGSVREHPPDTDAAPRSNLTRLFTEHGQSPWLDNVRRDWIEDGTMARLVERGVRGVTSNPAILRAAIVGTSAYDSDIQSASGTGQDEQAIYWDLVCSDIRGTAEILRPVFDESDGVDGYVSVEVNPHLAHDATATEVAGRELHDRIGVPNLYVKIPATTEGLAATRTMISEKRSINVTLIFSLERYAEVIEAYIAGLEEAPGDLSTVSSVASFFVSRVDAAVDALLAESAGEAARELRGQAATANAKAARALFNDRFSSERFKALEARGARPQRIVWASTSPKDPSYGETYYAHRLIGDGTVNTLPPSTLEAFDRDGTVESTLDAGLEAAYGTLARLEAAGVDLDEVTRRLEREGIIAFQESFDDVLGVLRDKIAGGSAQAG